MIRTKDSVEDLRKSRKRSQPTSTSSSSSSTPLDDLKRMAKKRREVAPSDTSLPPRQTKVKFALEKTRVFTRSYDVEDLINAWNSRAEAVMVKLGAQLTVETFKQGSLNTATDCIRGLEVHADRVRTEAKIMRGHTFTGRILDQQHFLQTIMGKANEQMLAKMSMVLSAKDVREAQEAGSRDADSALIIHACDHAVRMKSCGSSAPGKLLKDVASHGDLVTLLKQSIINSA